jgi:hypothetical protein
VSDVDPRTAALENQLDRLDEARQAGDEEPSTDAGTFDASPEGFGFHLDDPDHAVDALVDAVEPHEAVEDVETLDQLLSAFNDRDLEDLLAVVATDGEAPGLLGYDRDNLADAVTDLWERRPTVMLTRGELEGASVGVLWEHDGTTWWRIAVVCVDDIRDGHIGVIEFVDDAGLIERALSEEPDVDLLEGDRWQEWDEGTDG